MIKNFVKQCLENGGSVFPLLVDSSLTNGTGLTNPSIFTDNEKIYINLRHVEYTLYHSEKKKFCHPWGPIQYLHSENDMHLRTNNFFGELNLDFSIKYCNKVDTSSLDKEPLWEFVGLEDARIVKWDEKLYLCGVRRDTTTNGQGRMELSEIVAEGETFKEVSRFRIPTPGNADSYCEKNWMPILDMPYHFVKWCNPTEVVKVDIENNTTETIYLGKHVEYDYDFRGGSQVIPWGDDYRICLVHQVDLFKTRSEKRDARYRHRFIVWDKDWNVVKYCDPFDFISGEVEFAVGATFYNQNLLVTFGFQDNSSFLLEIPAKVLENHIGISINKNYDKTKRNKKIVDFFPYFHDTGRELLELRINMLKDYVDEFIICESNKTQSGIPIAYHLENDIKELGLPRDMIKIIKLEIPENDDLDIQLIDKYNCSENYKINENSINSNSLMARVRERMQKDSLLFAIDDYDEDTIFIHSDSDEIINPSHIDWIVNVLSEYPESIIKIPLVCLEGRADLRTFYSDSGCFKPWNGGMFFITKNQLKNYKPSEIRSGIFEDIPIAYLMHENNIVQDLGWHFSWMGKSKEREIKRKSFCHYDDTFSFLGNKSYSSEEVANVVDNCIVDEGSISPSGVLNTTMKRYPHNLLPSEIFSLPKVKNFLLPKTDSLNINDFYLNPEDPDLNFELAYYYHGIGHTASAFSHYLRCAERTNDSKLAYECLLRGFFCFDRQGGRKFTAKHLLNQALLLEPKRPEAYFLLARFYERNSEWYDCYTISSLALNFCDFDSEPLVTNVDYHGKIGILFEKAMGAWWWDKVDEAKSIFEDLLNNYDLSEEYRNCILNNLKRC